MGKSRRPRRPREEIWPRVTNQKGRRTLRTRGESSMSSEQSANAESDLAAVERLKEAYRHITQELAKVIVGQEHVIEELLMALFARGHCVLVGVPGLAKTLLIRTVADSLSLNFSRIQFTPDLMPSDIT